LAELNDAGVVAGCEGDLVSTVGMLWLSRLLDTPVWMANPAQIDQAAGTLRLAHCTVPRSMVNSYGLRSHFESGLAVGIQGKIPPGGVTLVRIGGVQLDRLWSVNGEATSAPPEEDLCRTQLEVRAPSEALAELLHAPLGNHILVVPGRHQERVYRWWQTMISVNRT
jgi:L-fucose isomerase-like protein